MFYKEDKDYCSCSWASDKLCGEIEIDHTIPHDKDWMQSRVSIYDFTSSTPWDCPSLLNQPCGDNLCFRNFHYENSICDSYDNSAQINNDCWEVVSYGKLDRAIKFNRESEELEYEYELLKEFRERSQGVVEDVFCYISAILKYLKVFDSNPTENAIVKRIVRGLNSNLRFQFEDQNINTLNDLVYFACELMKPASTSSNTNVLWKRNLYMINEEIEPDLESGSIDICLDDNVHEIIDTLSAISNIFGMPASSKSTFVGRSSYKSRRVRKFQIRPLSNLFYNSNSVQANDSNIFMSIGDRRIAERSCCKYATFVIYVVFSIDIIMKGFNDLSILCRLKWLCLKYHKQRKRLSVLKAWIKEHRSNQLIRNICVDLSYFK